MMKIFFSLAIIVFSIYGCSDKTVQLQGPCTICPQEVIIQPGDYRYGRISDIYNQIANEVESENKKVQLVLLEGNYKFDEALRIIPGIVNYRVVGLRGHSNQTTFVELYHPHKPGIRFESKDSVTIKDIQISRIHESQGGATTEAIRIDDCDHLLIKNIIIKNNRSADGAIHLVGCNSPLVTQNAITNYSRLNDDSSKVIGSAIDITQGVNIKVESNQISEENPFPATYFYDSAGIEVYNCSDVLIHQNTIMNAGQQAIDTNASNKVVVSENVIDGSWGFGMKTTHGSDQTEISENVFRKCGVAGVIIAAGNSTVTNVSITENEFFETGQGYSLNLQTGIHYYFSSGYFQGNELAFGIYIEGGLRNRGDFDCSTPFEETQYPTVKGVTVTGNDFYQNSEMGQYHRDNNGVTEQRCGDDNRKPPFDVVKFNNVVH